MTLPRTIALSSLNVGAKGGGLFVDSSGFGQGSFSSWRSVPQKSSHPRYHLMLHIRRHPKHAFIKISNLQ